jgi:hypothetical protein
MKIMYVIKRKVWIEYSNDCYHAVQKHLFSTLLSFLLYGCETWSVVLMEEYRLKISVVNWFRYFTIYLERVRI